MFRFCEFRVRKVKARLRRCMTLHRDSHRAADVCPGVERPAEPLDLYGVVEQGGDLGGERHVPPDAGRDS